MGVAQLPNLFYASPASGSGLFDYRVIAFSDVSGLGLGTLTSLALSAPSIFSVAGSPVTGDGTITLSLASQSGNYVFAAPSGSAGTPSFRPLTTADISGYSAGGGTGTVTYLGLTAPDIFSVSGSPITGSGTLDFSVVNQSARTFWAAPTGATGAPSFRLITATDISGLATSATGTVTYVGLTAPSTFLVNPNAVSGSGTLGLSYVNQSANQIFAGPTNGADAAPTFITLVQADLGAVSGTVTSVTMTVPSILSVAGSPITGSGSLDVTLANANANTFLGGPPTGAATTPTFRAIASGDVSTFAELIANKNQPNGYAGLDSNGQLVGIFIGRSLTNSAMQSVILNSGELATTTDTNELRLGDNITSGGIPLSINSPNTIYLPGAGSSGVNGANLLAAYARLTGLNPYGAPVSSTNPAILQLGPGSFDIRNVGTLDLNTSGVVIMGAGKGITTIYSDTTKTGYINLNSNYVTLANMTIKPSGINSVMYYNAGVGTGTYSATNTSVAFTDLEILQTSNSASTPNITMNTGIAVLGGTYIRCNTNHYFLSPVVNALGWTVSATFEDCVVGGGANSKIFGGGATTFTKFNGILRRCRMTTGVAVINLIVSGGLVEYCSLRSTVSNGDMFRVASGISTNQFYHNRLITAGTGLAIGDGGLTGLVMRATHNYTKNAFGAGITNNAATGTFSFLSGCNIADPSFTAL